MPYALKRLMDDASVRASFQRLPLRDSMMGEQFFTFPAIVFETQSWVGEIGFHDWVEALSNEENK